MSLDLLGAGEGLAKQYITLRVTSIDTEKLKKKIGGAKGAAIPQFLPLIDSIPQMALDIGLPFAKKMLADDYGITLEYSLSETPPGKAGKAISGYYPGVFAGLGIAAGIFAAWYFGVRYLLS